MADFMSVVAKRQEIHERRDAAFHMEEELGIDVV